ncbi:hypothetical protein [Amycolatopsis sp. NPDC058986]|uniref:hypothetical protein n=1 Tax=unclassified Amycolatopsis TaxID=2618356 RepID=UPI00366EEBF0
MTCHLEAHGQLLVRGTTVAEIVTRALTAFPLGFPPAEHAGVRLQVIHPGWWRVTPCRCRWTFASSNHPTWHYYPARSTDPGAWHGAEVRIRFAQGADSLSR